LNTEEEEVRAYDWYTEVIDTGVSGYCSGELRFLYNPENVQGGSSLG